MEPERPPLSGIAAILAREGGLTFGGGMPTIAALRREIIEKRGWLSEVEFTLAYALSRVCPGTNLLGFCAALGWQMRGATGCALALFASSVPCAVIALLLTIAYGIAKGHPLVKIGIDGASAAAVGIVAGSCWQLIEPSLRPRNRVRAILLVSGGALLEIFGVAPLRVLALAAIVGLFWREKQ